jgi:hypothetical protein
MKKDPTSKKSNYNISIENVDKGAGKKLPPLKVGN